MTALPGAPARLRVAGQEFTVPAGTPLHLALIQNGFYVETPCGARGTCRKCRVKLSGDVPPPGPADREHLGAPELDLGFRLSCQHPAAGALAVSILPEAVADPKKAALGKLAAAVAPDPWAPGATHGLAVDIGTTTLVAALLDLRTGEELAAFSAPNPQAMHGGDLMSRLTYATAAPGHRRELQVLVVRALNDLVARLCRRARVDPQQVGAAAVVGNTCMHHLFLGLEVASLAMAPYTPARSGAAETAAGALGLAVAPDAVVYTLPVIAGFVGADALAAGLAAGLDQADETVLVVDIGTNGECLLHHGGTVRACSAPAGPAFEGGEISQGMRANPGAIQGVDFTGTGLRLDVIPGAGGIRGICGSGLLDAVVALLRAGALDRRGGLQARGALAARVAGGAVALAPGVSLTQKDIRQLQLAKGAIRSGIEVLLREAAISAAALDAILLAGAFGNYLRRESAIAMGLLPPVRPEQVRPIGNAAAQGAKLVLLSKACRARAEALAGRIVHVELGTHPAFESIFLPALNFPAGGVARP